MDIAEWQNRLESTFNTERGVNPTVSALRQAEAAYGEYLERTYHGHRALYAAFVALFQDSLLRAVREYRTVDIKATAPYHSALFLDFITSFKSFCAADAIAYRGYPLDGYGLLRDLKDEAANLAAIGGGLSSYRALRGYSGDGPKDLETIRKAREREERRVARLVYGEDAGFDEPSAAALRKWMSLFHMEVHGSRLTTTEFNGWIQGREPLTMLPQPRQRAIGVYVTTFALVGWLHVRCLPLLQLTPNRFGPDWAHRWRVVEDSFRWMVGTWESADKTLPQAFEQLVRKRFAFDETTAYVERSVSADRDT